MAVLFFALLVLPAGADAHDLWVQPDRFVARPGERVAVRLRVGHGDDVKAVSRKPDRIVRFEGVGEGGARPLRGDAGADPAGWLGTGGLSGDQILVYVSNHAFIELAPDAFDRYLVHEGLESVRAEREARGEARSAGRERYARSAKALLTVGAPGAGFGRVLGLPIELVPLQDPRRLKASLHFRLLFEGRALPGARVELMRFDALDDAATATTDANGDVRFAPVGPGAYLVAATHMVRATTSTQADWRSEWATFTFERGR